MTVAAIGCRAAARALAIFAASQNSGECPTANGGQFWLLRIGLYELQRPKPPADDWVWIVDHTMQTGQGKLLIVVGMRLSAWNARRREALRRNPRAAFALQQRDLSMFLIEHVESSSGEVVTRQLNDLSRRTGITPCCVLSDQGADVQKGAQQFCQGRKTVVVHDIAHAVANAVKRQLVKDPKWQQFLTDANRSKTLLRQTNYAFLLPPELKNKARWLNLEPLLKWSQRVLKFLKDPRLGLARAQRPQDLETLEQKIGWLRQHGPSLRRWSRMLLASARALKYIRNEGYHRRAYRELRRRLEEFRVGPARAVADEVLSFVRAQSKRAKDRRVLGSSEVLESLIGHGKQMIGGTHRGYTKGILGLAAAVVDLSCTTVATAFAMVKVRDVVAWIGSQLGVSLQAATACPAFSAVRNKNRIKRIGLTPTILRRPVPPYRKRRG